MNTRRSTLEVRNVRLPGDGRDEVHVGAYARRIRRKRLWLAVLGAALILGAIGLYLNLRPVDDTRRHAQVQVPIRCGECGLEETRAIPIGDSPPYTCSRCGQKRVRPLWKCSSCSDVFVPVKSTHPVKCAKCGSDRVGSAAPPAQ